MEDIEGVRHYDSSNFDHLYRKRQIIRCARILIYNKLITVIIFWCNIGYLLTPAPLTTTSVSRSVSKHSFRVVRILTGKLETLVSTVRHKPSWNIMKTSAWKWSIWREVIPGPPPIPFVITFDETSAEKFQYKIAVPSEEYFHMNQLRLNY